MTDELKLEGVVTGTVHDATVVAGVRYPACREPSELPEEYVQARSGVWTTCPECHYRREHGQRMSPEMRRGLSGEENHPSG